MPQTRRSSEKSTRDREYYQRNRERIIARVAAYNAEHPEVRAASHQRNRGTDTARWRELRTHARTYWTAYFNSLTEQEQSIAAHVMVALAQFDSLVLAITFDWGFDAKYLAPHLELAA